MTDTPKAHAVRRNLLCRTAVYITVQIPMGEPLRVHWLPDDHGKIYAAENDPKMPFRLIRHVFLQERSKRINERNKLCPLDSPVPNIRIFQHSQQGHAVVFADHEPITPFPEGSNRRGRNASGQGIVQAT